MTILPPIQDPLGFEFDLLVQSWDLSPWDFPILFNTKFEEEQQSIISDTSKRTPNSGGEGVGNELEYKIVALIQI